MGRTDSPPSASAFAINLAPACPRRPTRSRPWLALCDPPSAEAFAIRLGLPLKGGVIPEFLEQTFAQLDGGRPEIVN